MNKFTRSVLITAGFFAMLASISAHSQQIYTWTDEHGVVHFVDTPPDNPNAVSMDAPGAQDPVTIDANPPVDGDPSATEDSDDGDLSVADQARLELREKTEEHRRQQAEDKKNCDQARALVDRMEPSRRVYYTNEQGETERMDDEQRVRMVAEGKMMIAKYCK